MFETLQANLAQAIRRFHGTSLAHARVSAAISDLRYALLHSEAHPDVIETFLVRVEQSLRAAPICGPKRTSQRLAQIVYENLVRLIGPVHSVLPLEEGRPTVILLCGLSGAGTTTSCVKLAKFFSDSGKRSLLVAVDDRPLACDPLNRLAAQLDLPVYSEADADPLLVCKNAVKEAVVQNANVVILDAPGPSTMEKDWIVELRRLNKAVGLDRCFLVADARDCQKAVQITSLLNEALRLDGVVLTRLDLDRQGGAALSLKEATGVPIKFAGMGEELDALEPFRPEGMAARMLGMGEVLGLVHRAQRAIDAKVAAKQQAKMENGNFDLDDFRTQLSAIKGMGSGGMRGLMEMLPGGMGKMIPGDADPDREAARVAGMLDSMTPFERRNPDSIVGSRCRRIAAGAGVDVEEVAKLLRQFGQMRKVMRQMASMSMLERLKTFAGMNPPNPLSHVDLLLASVPAASAKPIEQDKPSAKPSARWRRDDWMIAIALGALALLWAMFVAMR